VWRRSWYNGESERGHEGWKEGTSLLPDVEVTSRLTEYEYVPITNDPKIAARILFFVLVDIPPLGLWK
jgi:hypothetical protein